MYTFLFFVLGFASPLEWDVPPLIIMHKSSSSILREDRIENLLFVVAGKECRCCRPCLDDGDAFLFPPPDANGFCCFVVICVSCRRPLVIVVQHRELELRIECFVRCDRCDSRRRGV